MRLRGRIARLEARPQVAGMAARGPADLTGKLGALLQGVQAGADYSDRPDASPAERYCLALLRGEAGMANDIINNAAGGS